MIMNIDSKTLQTRRLAKDYLHRTHSLLTCFYIFFCSAIISTFLVIVLNQLNLFLIEQDLRDTRVIFDRNSQSIGNGLIHGITIYFVTKGLVCFCNRSSSKTYERCLRKGFS